MQAKLSPFGFDFGRYLHLISSPNVGYAKPTGPHDEVFPDTGLVRLPAAIPHALCDEVIAEYDAFEKFRRDRGCVISDANDRNYRVVNLHLRSVAMLRAGLNAAAHDVAGRFFGATATLYTSLYFKHGSQQSPHIDTPFFWTRPFNLFVGLWVAFEDVRPEAGPLSYYPGSHRHFNSEAELTAVYRAAGGDVQRMFGLMQAEIEKHGAPESVLIKKGDAVIWHPGLMHAGTLAKTAGLTRNSGVFHLAPRGVNVRDDRTFPADFSNYPKYGLQKFGDGYYCRGGLPKAMI